MEGPGRVDGHARTWPSTSCEPAYLDLEYRQENFDHVQSMVECFFLMQAARRGLPRRPGARAADRRDQRARGPVRRRAPQGPRSFFVDVEHDGRQRRSTPAPSTASRPSARSRARPRAEAGRTHRRGARQGGRTPEEAVMIDDELAFAGRDKCAVVGHRRDRVHRDSGRGVLSLATEASLKAIADAGLTVDDIDGIVRCEQDTVRPNAWPRRWARRTSLLGRHRARRRGALHDDGRGHGRGDVRPGQGRAGVPLAERPLGMPPGRRHQPHDLRRGRRLRQLRRVLPALRPADARARPSP